MIEEGVRDGITEAVCCYFQANNKNMDKKMMKLKNQHIFNIMMPIVCMPGQ